MGAVFGDRFLRLGFVAPNSPNFFTKNAFNSIRELFFPRQGSMSHEKNGCSTKATHGATTEWEQCLEICFYVLDLWPRILRNFFTKNAFNSIRELFFPREGSMSHERNGFSTKATHGATTEWEQCLEICFYCFDLCPEFSEIFSQKMHLIRYESYF